MTALADHATPLSMCSPSGEEGTHQTRIGQARASLADMAIHQLTSMGVNIRGKPVLLVGSGRMRDSSYIEWCSSAPLRSKSYAVDRRLFD